jgi:hypothetical protein
MAPYSLGLKKKMCMCVWGGGGERVKGVGVTGGGGEGEEGGGGNPPETCPVSHKRVRGLVNLEGDWDIPSPLHS